MDACFATQIVAVYGLLVALFKIVVASLLAGAALHALNFSAEDVLNNLGLTPDRVVELLQQGWAWALPNILLGSIVILPAWFLMALLRPPRQRD
jgi:hypothetical protein